MAPLRRPLSNQKAIIRRNVAREVLQADFSRDPEKNKLFRGPMLAWNG